MTDRSEFEKWYSREDPERREDFERLVSDSRYTSMEVEWACRGFYAGRECCGAREKELESTIRFLLEQIAKDHPEYDGDDLYVLGGRVL